MGKREFSSWEECLKAFTRGFGSKDPSICDPAFLAKEIFELRMPEDFKYYGKAGIRSDMLCRDLVLLGFSRKAVSKKEAISKCKHEFEVGKYLSTYDPRALRTAASYLWNGNQNSGDLSEEEFQQSKDIVEKLKKAKNTFLPH